MASKEKTVDAKALMASIAKGWKLVDTPKVRAGFKKGQQKLVQANGKTLGLVTLREQGVRVEGSRLARNVTVPKDATVEQARKLLTDVEQENAQGQGARGQRRRRSRRADRQAASLSRPSASSRPGRSPASTSLRRRASGCASARPSAAKSSPSPSSEAGIKRRRSKGRLRRCSKRKGVASFVSGSRPC